MTGTDIEWDTMVTWTDGLWRATAIGPKDGLRFVTMSVTAASSEGARRLLRAMLYLKCVSPMARA